MADQSAKLRLGAFMLAGLVGLTSLAVLFGGAPRVFDSRVNYVVKFREAPGLSPGVPVRKSGVRIGEVSSMDLDEESSQVIVRIQVEKKYLPRENEDATIFRGILNGDTSLDFVPKQSADGRLIVSRGNPYPPDSEIQGQTPLNPNTLVRQASGVLPTAQESIARILNSINRFEQALPKIERAFDEVGNLARSSREIVPELRRTNEKVQNFLAFADVPNPQPGGAVAQEPAGLNATLREFREFVKTLKPLVEDVRRVIATNEQDVSATVKSVRKVVDGVNEIVTPENAKAVSGTIKNVQTASDDVVKIIRLTGLVLDQADKSLREINGRLAQAESLLKSADRAFTDADGVIKNLQVATKPIAENADQIVKNVNLTADQLTKTLAELRGTLQGVNRGDGTFQKFINDPTIYNNINDAAVSLTRTLLRAEKIAQDLQVFADKVARRPESIGVGGALRPNSGLKESPYATTPTPVQPIAPVPSSGTMVPSYRPNLPPARSDLPPK